jgi:signal peptidase I
LSELPSKVWSAVKRYKVIVGSLLLVLLVLGGLFVYSGMWPPVYVVESASMQHSDTESSLGLIDTGDLVIVQSSDGIDVKTYVECYPNGERNFGDYGNVIVYERYGSSEKTPIIHRAMMLVVYNATSNSFDIPSLASLPSEKWTSSGSAGQWWNLTDYVVIHDVGYKSAELTVDLRDLMDYYERFGLNVDGLQGYITMGDHNVQYMGGEYVGLYDQSSQQICLALIDADWIVGEAKQEIAWLGLIKLWVNGQMPDYTPENSKTAMIAVIAIVIVVPISLDVTNYVLQKKGIDIWKELKDRFKRKEG